MNGLVKLMMELIKSQALGLSLAENNGVVFSDDDLKKLYINSKRHDLAHMVGSALIKNGLIKRGTELDKAFSDQVFKAVGRFERNNHELQNICHTLENAKVKFIPLKGSVLREYYAEPWLRTSCDIDIFVEEKNIDVAIDALVKELGFKAEGVWVNEKSVFSPSGVHVEMHYLVDKSKRTEIYVLEDVWENSKTKDGKEFQTVMSWEYFYLYHIAHMAKHFAAGGCGLRSFLDLAVMKEKLPIDWQKAEQLLKDKGFYDFYVGCKKLVDVWFFGDEYDELSQKMEEYILKAGVYGDRENWVAVQQVKKGGGTVKHLFRRLFPPYKDMILIYPKLKGRKWMLPLYQIRKWFRLFKPGVAKRGVREMKITANMTDQKRKDVVNLLKKLGIEE